MGSPTAVIGKLVDGVLTAEPPRHLRAMVRTPQPPSQHNSHSLTRWHIMRERIENDVRKVVDDA